MLCTCTATFMWRKHEFVRVGQLFDSSHPLVVKFPQFFREVLFDDAGRVVEQATQAPGERRNIATRLRAAQAQASPVVAEVAEVEPVEVDDRGKRPWTNASKEDWVEYAAGLGVDGAQMTKVELMDAVEAAEKATV